MSPYRMLTICAVMFLLLTSCSAHTADPNNNKVLLIAQEQSEDIYVAITKEVNPMVKLLEEAGYEVVVATHYGRHIDLLNSSAQSATLDGKIKLSDVNVADYAGVMLPGMGAPCCWEAVDPDAVRIVQEAVAHGKPIAAQMGSVFILHEAGVLEGKQYAMLGAQELQERIPEGIYKGAAVVIDGNIITSGVDPVFKKWVQQADNTAELTRKFMDALESAP